MKHSITCWAVECDGYPCTCWCHSDEPPQEGGDE